MIRYDIWYINKKNKKVKILFDVDSGTKQLKNQTDHNINIFIFNNVAAVGCIARRPFLADYILHRKGNIFQVKNYDIIQHNVLLSPKQCIFI